MSERPTIALVEFRWHGHHPAFFAAFQEELEPVSSVIPFRPRSEASAILPEREMEDEVLAHWWIRKWPAVANLYRFARCARRLRAYERKYQMRFDLVAFPSLYSGACLSVRLLDRLFPYRWVALSLDSDCCRRRSMELLWRAKTLDTVSAFRARNCRAVMTLDRGIVGCLQAKLPETSVEFLPEPVRVDSPNETFEPALEIKRAAAGRKIVGCFGQFDKRKGGLEFLQTARACRSEPYFFVWVGALIEGSFSSSELSLISKLREELSANTLLLFQPVTNTADFNALISVADLLFLCYADHAGSSNMVHTAAVFQKPVLVSEDFCMADDVRRYSLGVSARRGDIAAYAAGLRALTRGQSGVHPNYEAYRRDHSAERRSEALRKMVQAGLAN